MTNEKSRRELPDDGKVFLCRYKENGELYDRVDVTGEDIPLKMAYSLYNSNGIGVVSIGIELSDGTSIGKIDKS